MEYCNDTEKKLMDMYDFIRLGDNPVCRECNTPMTISIQGSWGTGKTSIMNLVKNEMPDNYRKGLVQYLAVFAVQHG